VTKMMESDLEQRWSRLSPDPDKRVFQLYDVDHPLSFYIGRDISGARLLLLVSEQRPSDVQDLRYIQMQILRREDGKWSLLLSLKDEGLRSVFVLLCADLLNASKAIPTPEQALSFVLKRLSNWRRLLEKDRNGLLNEAEIRGLCGELAFMLSLMELVAISKFDVVRSWGGPEGAPQDFQLSDSVFEIKTVRPDALSVRISSEKQLYSLSRTVYLVVFCLGDAADVKLGSFSLNELVLEVKKAIETNYDALELFEAKLAEAGYVSRDEYDQYRYFIVSQTRYLVGDGFPCIRPSELPSGVGKVSYDITLGTCQAFKIS